MYPHQIEFHNIAELRVPGWPPNAFQLQRVPEAVRLKLNEGAQRVSLATANAELRFVCDGPFRIHLNTPNGPNEFHIGYGPFFGRSYPIQNCAVQVDVPEHLPGLDRSWLKESGFSPDVVRIFLPSAPVLFFRLEAERLRPPRTDEVPSQRLLCCGTSITQGGSAVKPHLGYAALTATELGLDLINLGMSGSFHAEPELAEYVAAREDWDIATVEISVNMVTCFAEEAFQKRVRFFINTIAAAHPEKPVACITLYPYFNDFCAVDPAMTRKAARFREIVREEVGTSNCRNLHLIEGREILDRIEGLTPDLIHPSDFGMMRMASNLAKRLTPLLPRAT